MAAPPATISRPLLGGLLRQELGYEGLIVSDTTGMMGFATRLSLAERVPAAINAGIDLYLGANVDVDYPALVAAVQEGRVQEERIQEAARRVLALKARLQLFDQPMGPAPSAADVRGFQQAAQRMADKSITLVRSDGGIRLG